MIHPKRRQTKIRLTTRPRKIDYQKTTDFQRRTDSILAKTGSSLEMTETKNLAKILERTAKSPERTETMLVKIAMSLARTEMSPAMNPEMSLEKTSFGQRSSAECHCSMLVLSSGEYHC